MICNVCKKVSGFRIKRVLLRGHYNPTCKQKQHPNLQWIRVPVLEKNKKGTSGSVARFERIKACAKCIKASRKDPNYINRKLEISR